MKKLISYLPIALLSTGLLFTSCKKENKIDTTDTSEFKDQSDDDTRFANETDAVADDATAALESLGGSYVGGRPMSPTAPFPLRCDASVVVDTASNPRTLTITYNGDSCIGNRRSRTGTVIISFAPAFRWSAAGAQYTVTYQNLKVTRRTDNKSITINGTKTITNVSGGKLRDLATSGTNIVHEVSSSNMSVTFDNGTQRTWQVARRRTFSYNNGIVISVTGFGAPGNIAEWGSNRAGNTFTTAIIEPLVVKQSCDFRLVSGKVQHTGRLITTTTTFGLDANGSPVSNCPAGPFYYKVVWTGPAGTPYTFIAPY